MPTKTTLRLKHYSAAVAGLAGAAVAPGASAAIIYTEANTEFGIGGPYDSAATFGFPLEIDFDGLNGAEFEISQKTAAIGSYFYFRFARWGELDFGTDGTNQGFISGDPLAGVGNDLTVDAGAEIGPAQSSQFTFTDINPPSTNSYPTGDQIVMLDYTATIYGDKSALWFGEPIDGSEAFLGVTFQLGATGTQQYFGWIGIEFLAGEFSGTGRITGWAYEDTGAAIAAGDMGPTVVPIPPTLPLLASGYAGLAFFRNRKKRANNSIVEDMA